MSRALTIVFGLTADPIHLGHEQAVINGVRHLQSHHISIKKVLLIPVYQPHLIANKKVPVANFKHRFSMCQMVASRLSSRLGCTIEVSDIEKQLAKKTGQANYSINTLAALAEDRALFMVSADHFQGRWPKFRKWHQWQDLLKNTGLLINQRPGHGINHQFIEQLKLINKDVFVVNSDQVVDTSSTKIRNNINKAIDSNCLSQDVIEYLIKQQIY